MNGIATFSIVGTVASGICILNDTINRKLPFGSKWTRLRVGFRGAFSITGSINAGSCPLFMGLDSSGATYGYPNRFLTDATGVRAVGLFINEPMATGTSGSHWDSNASGNLFIDQHEDTVDFSVQLGVSPRLNSLSGALSVLIMEFTKGDSGISIELIYNNSTASTTTADFNSSMSAATMSNALAILGASYSSLSKTITGAIGRNQYGELDRICMSSASSPNYSISGTTTPGHFPVIQNLAVRRLY